MVPLLATSDMSRHNIGGDGGNVRGDNEEGFGDEGWCGQFRREGTPRHQKKHRTWYQHEFINNLMNTTQQITQTT